MAFSTYAATVTVVSVGNTFSPSTINVSVGDSIQFNITNAHDVVEVSMATYNANGNTSNGGFTLPFGGGNLNGLAAGTYYYVCTPHAAGGMKGTITVTAAPPSGCDLLITGAFDGPLSGGIPKLLELKVLNNIADLSVYGVSSVTNGQGTTGAAEFTFPAVAAAAGDFIYIATDSTSVFTYFGFYPNYVNNFMSVNGDDALELFLNGAVVDVFGEVDCDPNTGAGITNCPQWEYLDGWAYRNNGASCASTFDYTDWTFSGANATDGETLNSTATAVFPVGTYQLVATPKMNIETPAFTMNEADPTTTVTRFILNPAAATNGTYQIHLVGGTGSAADLDLTAFGGGPFPLTLPYAIGNDTLIVPITPVNDAVYEGTETFNFVLRNLTGGLLLGADSTFTLTLTDDELPLDTTINANPTKVTANEGAGTVDLTFEISQVSAGSTTFTADLQLNSGDPADINGYTTQTISFPSSGGTAQTVTITLTDDALIEGTESLIFELVNPSAGLTLGAQVLDTLVITDNDAVTFDIATISSTNATGNPDSLGVVCKIAGVVMGINYADAPDVSFYVHDGTGGMGVFNAAGTAGYTVNEGDLVEVSGVVGFFNGLTQVVGITDITVTGTGTLPAIIPTTTPLGENTEGELVKLSNVTVVNQASWNTGAGAGFNVDVTDGTNTYSVRIDKSADLFSMALPGCVLDVTGIGTQFDNSSPYTSGYQMLPRYAADIAVIMPCTASTVTIADATEVDPVSGDPLMFGTDVVLKGIITSPDFRELQATGTEFTFSDGTGGIWAYSTDSTISFNPVVGDSVQVTGNIGAASGVTRLYIDAVTSLGAATPFTPTVVSAALGEPQEAELIKINGLKLNGIWNSSGGSYNISATANGITYDIRVDADRIELFSVPLTPSLTFNLTGVGSQFDATAPRTEGYQILPRFDSDIEIVNGINDLELANFSVSPIPASDILNFSFDYNANEIVTVAVIDILGKEVASKQVSLVKGMNVNSISVETLNTGFYVFQIKTTNGTKNTNILVK